jgi:hypothetical protein
MRIFSKVEFIRPEKSMVFARSTACCSAQILAVLAANRLDFQGAAVRENAVRSTRRLPRQDTASKQEMSVQAHKL